MDDLKQDNNNVNDINTNENKEIQDFTNTNFSDPPVIMPDQKREEEVAAEITGFDDKTVNRVGDTDTGNQTGSIPGWIGLALSILSFFMMPIILGGAAIIVGFLAKGRDATWLGNTAIALGVISIIVRLFFIPFT